MAFSLSGGGVDKVLPAEEHEAGEGQHAAVHDAAEDAGLLDALLVEGDGRGYHGRYGHALEAASR